jgi:putative lipoic acid-binding regulatory protein
VIVNEKSATIQELWDGESLKCTFRRTVGQRLMNMWDEVVQLATTICFSNEEDNLIWQFSSNGIYSSQSLYWIINNRGILPIFVSAVWSLKVPPRIHFFLCFRKTRTSPEIIYRKGEK